MKRFFSSAAALSLITSMMSTAPEPAAAQSYLPRNMQPESCRILQNEQRTYARQQQTQTRNLARQGSYALQGRNNRSAGLAILGQFAGNKIGDAQEERYIGQLQQQCAYETEQLQQGSCVENTGSLQLWEQ